MVLVCFSFAYVMHSLQCTFYGLGLSKKGMQDRSAVTPSTWFKEREQYYSEGDLKDDLKGWLDSRNLNDLLGKFEGSLLELVDKETPPMRLP